MESTRELFEPMSILPWKIASSRDVYAAEPWVRVSVQKVELPDGRTVEDYHQIRLADYAGVVLLLDDETVLFERHYKHGVRGVSLSLPGGGINPGESPLEAIQRELLEETGYMAEEWHSLGSYVCDGNYGCGKANLFFARKVRRVAEPNSRDLEEMEMVFLKKDQVINGLQEGRFAILGVAAALALALHRGFL